MGRLGIALHRAQGRDTCSSSPLNEIQLSHAASNSSLTTLEVSTARAESWCLQPQTSIAETPISSITKDPYLDQVNPNIS